MSKKKKQEETNKPNSADQHSSKVDRLISNESILQYEKVRAIETYSKALKEESAKSQQQFQEVLKKIHSSYEISIQLYQRMFWVAVFLLLVGLIVGILQLFVNTTKDATWLIFLCLAGGTILIIFSRNRDSFYKVRYLVNNLAKLNVVFAGYFHQMQQVDMYLINLFLSIDDLSIVDVEDSLKRVQDIIDRALEGVTEITEEIDLL